MAPRARTALLVLLAIAAGIAAALLLQSPGVDEPTSAPLEDSKHVEMPGAAFARAQVSSTALTRVLANAEIEAPSGASAGGPARESGEVARAAAVTASAAPNAADATTPTARKARRRSAPAATNGPAFRVRVVDDASGAPVPKAVVEISAAGAQDPVRAITGSDESGTAAFEDIAAGPAALKVKAPGFARSRLEGGQDAFERAGTAHPLRIDGDALARGVTVRLARGAEVLGRVVGPDGELVVASVCAVDETGAVAEEGHSDERGVFRLDRLDLAPGARIRVRAAANGFAPGEVEARATSVGAADGLEGAEVVVRLGRAAVIAGRVTDPSGAPVAGARISVRQGGWMVRSSEDEPTTAADGTFEFPGIEPGTVEVFVRAKGHAAWRREVEARAGDAPTAVDAALEADRTISLRLVDPRGAPVDIVAFVIAMTDTEDALAVSATFERGRATLEGLEARAYRLLVMAGENQERSMEIARVLPSEETVDVVVPDVLRVRLRITPVEFERETPFVSWFYERHRTVAPADYASVDRDDDGRYTQEIVPGGVAALWVLARDFAPVRVVLPAKAGAPGEVLDVTASVERGGIVSGGVLDAKGHQVASARIVVRPAGMPEVVADRRYPTETSIAGTFHVDALPTGIAIEITAEREAAKGGGRATVRVEPLASGETRAGVTLTLPEGP